MKDEGGRRKKAEEGRSRKEEEGRRKKEEGTQISLGPFVIHPSSFILHTSHFTLPWRPGV
jgi:hypothetical protein